MQVAAGLNSAGIANAAGVGQTLSEWIVEGKPSRDVWGVDIRRFGAFHRSPEFLRDRCAEVLGLHYAMPWPRKELESLLESSVKETLIEAQTVIRPKGW